MAWRVLPSVECNCFRGSQLSLQRFLLLWHCWPPPGQADHHVMPQIPGKALPSELQGSREAADCYSREEMRMYLGGSNDVHLWSQFFLST